MTRLLATLLAFGLQLSVCGAFAAQVTLSWQDNSDNEDGFRVERAIGDGAFVEISGSVAANAVSYKDVTVTAGTSYRYRIRAFNTHGNSAFSNVASITLPADGTAPGAPGEIHLEIPGTLSNVSNRGTIMVGDGTMIPGFVITGGPLRVLIRVVGPTIGGAPYNVPSACADPRLSLRNQAGAEVAANDNWLAADAAVMAQAGAFALPTNSKDAALVITLPPGNYTVVTSGVGGAEGVALAEVYAVP